MGVRFGSSSAPKEVGREKVVASTDGLDLKEKPGEAVGNEDEVKRGTPLGYSSTSFGFRMERVGDEDDPKKWIKYGLKYAGALVVFFAVLGSLKSYEVSQRKKIDAERRAREGRKNLPPVNPSNADISNVEASSTEPPIDMPVQIPVATGLLFPIKTEEPEEILDPIDELLVEVKNNQRPSVLIHLHSQQSRKAFLLS